MKKNRIFDQLFTLFKLQNPEKLKLKGNMCVLFHFHDSFYIIKASNLLSNANFPCKLFHHQLYTTPSVNDTSHKF